MATIFNPDAPAFVPRTPNRHNQPVVCPDAPRKRPVTRRRPDPTHWCDCCGEKFQGWDYKCSDCRDTISILEETTPETPDICFLMIDFNVSQEEHDGYCSDGHNFRTKKTRVRRIFPVPRGFASEGSNDATHDPQIKYFIPSDVSHGNGYCGCKTTYTVLSAKWKETPPHSCDDLKEFLSQV
jgi:hypothetical protein